MNRFVCLAVVLLTLLPRPSLQGDDSQTNGYNRPKQLGQGVYDPRQKSEMDLLASKEETAALVAKTNTDAVLFAEDREHSIRWAKELPRRWLNNLPAHTSTFRGTAQPGEFYVFQIGVFAAKRDLNKVSVEFGPLLGTKMFDDSNLRCISTGGIDHIGNSFVKDVGVAQGQLQAARIGIDAPEDRQRGR